jgi:hypothetical protein
MRPPLPLILLHTKYFAFYLLIIWTIFNASATSNSDIKPNDFVAVDDEEQHPDPNDENYPGMIYIGRVDDDGKRIGFDADNGTRSLLFQLSVYHSWPLNNITNIRLYHFFKINTYEKESNIFLARDSTKHTRTS